MEKIVFVHPAVKYHDYDFGGILLTFRTARQQRILSREHWSTQVVGLTDVYRPTYTAQVIRHRLRFLLLDFFHCLMISAC